jgi:integration host factor subunit alpha
MAASRAGTSRAEPRETASSRTITRVELAAAAAVYMKGDRKAAYGIVADVLDEIVAALADKEDVLLSGFGKFQIRAKGERVGRNPKTGVESPISARHVVVFKASRQLRVSVAEGATTAD